MVFSTSVIVAPFPSHIHSIENGTTSTFTSMDAHHLPRLPFVHSSHSSSSPAYRITTQPAAHPRSRDYMALELQSAVLHSASYALKQATSVDSNWTEHAAYAPLQPPTRINSTMIHPSQARGLLPRAVPWTPYTQSGVLCSLPPARG